MTNLSQKRLQNVKIFMSSSLILDSFLIFRSLICKVKITLIDTSTDLQIMKENHNM